MIISRLVKRLFLGVYILSLNSFNVLVRYEQNTIIYPSRASINLMKRLSTNHLRINSDRNNVSLCRVRMNQ